MLEVTVKTLDGKNRSFSVPDDITVKEFKEKIAPSVEISAENQRLIFSGRVLQDDKKLKDQDVDGKVLHVVERPPPSLRGQNGSSASGGASANDQPRPQTTTHQHNFVLGSFQLPTENVEPNQVEGLVQQALSGMGNFGRNARVSARTSGDGSSLDVHINLGQIQMPTVISEATRRLDTARSMITQARQVLDRIERVSSSNEGAGERSTPATSSPLRMDTTEQTQSTAATDGAVGVDLDEDERTILAAATQHLQNDGESVQAITIVTQTVEAEMEIETDQEGAGATAQNVATATETRSSQAVEVPNTGSDSGSQTGQTTQASAQPTAQTDSQTQQTSASTGTQTENQASRSLHPPPSDMAALLDDVFQLNQRFQPHLERYQRIMREDPQFDGQAEESRKVQTFINQVSEVLHFISHAYHSLSDIMYECSTAPPRHLRAPPSVMPSVRPMQMPVGTPAQTASSSSATTASTRQSTASTTRAASNVTPTSATGTPMPTPAPQTASSGSATSTAPQWGPLPPPGTFAAGTGRPPFMPPEVFNNIMSMATAAAQQGQHNVTPAGQVIVVTQSGGAPTPPIFGTQSTTAASHPAPPAPTGQPRPQVSIQATTVRVPAQIRIGVPSTAAAGTPPAAPGQGPRPRGVAIAIPGLPPANLMGQPLLPGSNAVDQMLPCNSRHFLHRQASAAANVTGASVGTTAQNPESTLAGMVSNLVGGLIGGGQNMQGATGGINLQNPAAAGNAGRGPVTNPFAALFGGDVRAPRPMAPPAARPQQPGAGNFADQLRTILQQGQQAANQSMTTSSNASSTTTTQPSSTTAQQSAGGGSARVSDEMFTQLVTGISQYVGQASTGQAPQGTMSDFLTALGEGFTTPQGESILTDIFNVLASQVNFMELMAIFSGTSGSLQRVREPLQTYIRQHLLNGESASAENIEACVDRQMQLASPYIEQACVDLSVKDDIDMEASIHTFMEHHLNQLLTFIMNARADDADFHQTLYTRMRRIVHEAVVMGENCMEGGFSAVQRFVQTRIASLATDVNPIIREWMSSMTAQQVGNMRPNITVTAADIQQYIIKSSQKMETGSSKSSENDEEFMSADEETPAESQVKKARVEETACKKAESDKKPAQQQEARQSRSSYNHGRGEDEPFGRMPNGDIVPRIAPEGGRHSKHQTARAELYDEKGDIKDNGSCTSAAGRPQMTPMAYHTVRCAMKPKDDGQRANVEYGSEDWHRVVPREWVEVIATDVERQKKVDKQRPLSDAYMSGNPAKKRKHCRSEAEELGYPQNTLPQSLMSAAATVGAQPITSQETLSQDIASSSSLQQAFHSEVRNEVRRQLRENRDLVPYKYKNTEKYFGNKK